MKVAVWVVIAAIAVFVLGLVAIGVFERYASWRRLRAWQRWSKPFFRPWVGYGMGFALIETTGRRTGLPRRIPVGGKRSGSTFWFTAMREADYLRNIASDPRVRVRTGGRWRSGTAVACPEDDAKKRSFRVNPINGAFLWLANQNLVSVRVDLDPR